MATETKSRHGCLTAWLVVGIGFGVLSLLSPLIGFAREHSAAFIEFYAEHPTILKPTSNMSTLSTIQSLLTFFLISPFEIAILKWRKWGFWGYCAGVIILNIISIIVKRESIWLYIINPIISISILFALLHIGKDNKAWPQLD